MKEVAVLKDRRRGNGAIRAVGIFALGAAAGSIIALLFAPASGQVTRRRIVLKLRAARKAAGRRIGQAQKVLARRANSLREAATQRLGSAREWVVSHVPSGNGNGHAKRTTRRAIHHA